VADLSGGPPTGQNPSNTSEYRQDHNDQQNQSNATAGVISPARAVRPGGQRAEQKQDQNDEEDGVHIVFFPFMKRLAQQIALLGDP